jgi:hypothetical protein
MTAHASIALAQNLHGGECELGRNAAADYSEEKTFRAPDGR